MTEIAPGLVDVGPPTHFFIDEDGSLVIAPQALLPEGIEASPLPADYALYPAQAWKRDGDAVVEDVEGERLRLWAEVKQQRVELSAEGVEVPGLGTVQTDPASLAAIDNRWAAAQADPEHWSAEWTMADNEREPVDYGAMRQIKLTVDAHIDVIRTAADAVRDELFDEDVTTLAALYAVPLDLTLRL